MNPDKDARNTSPPLTVWGVRIGGAVAILIGGFWLTAWLGGWAGEWSAGGALVMKTNLALCLSLGGLALLLLGGPEPSRARRVAGRVLALSVFLIGALTLSEHLFHYDLGIDQVLAREAPGAVATASPNRMGPPASLSLVLLGAGLFMFAASRRTFVPWLGLMTCAVNFAPAIGFLYGVAPFYSRPHLTGIAWPSVMALMALGIGLVLAVREKGPMVLLLRDDAGGALLRRMLPAAIFIPIILGFLEVQGEQYGLLDAETRTSLLVMTLMVIFVALLWRGASQVSRNAAQVKLSYKTFSELIGRSPFGTYIVDSRFRIAMMNAASQDGAFRNVRLVIGRPFNEAMHILWPDTVAEEIISHFRHTLDTGEPYYSPPFINPRHDVAIVESYEWELQRMTLPDGQYGVICYYFDSTRIRQAEEALQESEERFRLFMDNSPGIAWIKDEEGRHVYLSKTYEERFGATLEAWRGKTDFELWPADIAQTFRDNDLAVLRDGQPQQLIEQARNADGTVSWWLNSKFLLCDAAGRRFVAGTGWDITARKQAEEALRVSEERYRNLFENIEEMVTVYEVERDDDGQIVERRLRDANRSFLRAVGVSSIDDIRGKTVSQIFGKVWSDVHLPAVQKAMDTGQVQVQEVYRPESGRHYITSVVRLDGQTYLGTGWDITARKQTEAALRESEESLRTQRQRMPIGCIVSDANNCFSQMNPAAERILGYSEAELRGRHASVIVPEAQRPQVDNVLRRLAEGDMTAHSVNENVIKDGRTIICQWTNTPLRDAQGAFIGSLSMVEDVTDRKRAEEALRKAHDELELRVQERTAQLHAAYETLKKETDERKQLEDQLRQAQKMEALGTLTGGIAHDFNNILAAILGFTEMSLDDVPQGSLLEKNLRHILNSSFRARDLIRQMLTFSRKTEYEIKPLSLTPLVKETAKLLRASIPTTIQIDVSSAATSDTVLANATGMQQIIMNLSTNAAYAMRETGGKLSISLSDADPNIRLTVQDTGTGMDAETIKRIFEPFFTTKEVGQGTGMGLAVVYGIVKSLKGDITVESRPGKGSTFHVFFPKADTQETWEVSTAKAVPIGRERILFVDDEEMLTELGGNILERLGYTVTAMTESKEALKLFSKDPARFDLIVTDQTMPELTGLHLAEKLLKVRPDIPIILCTGHSDSVNPESARAAGIREFLMKPLAKQELAKAVRMVLDVKTGN